MSKHNNNAQYTRRERKQMLYVKKTCVTGQLNKFAYVFIYVDTITVQEESKMAMYSVVFLCVVNSCTLCLKLIKMLI